MELEPLRGVLRPERSRCVDRYRRRCQDVGQRPAIRPPELERAIRESLELEALLVHRAVMPAT